MVRNIGDHQPQLHTAYTTIVLLVQSTSSQDYVRECEFYPKRLIRSSSSFEMLVMKCDEAQLTGSFRLNSAQ